MTIIEKVAGGVEGGARLSPTGTRPSFLSVVARRTRRSPGGKEIWAANAQDRTIDHRRRVKKSDDTLAANVNGPTGSFTPDGTHVLVSSLGGAELAISTPIEAGLGGSRSVAGPQALRCSRTGHAPMWRAPLMTTSRLSI
jgi:hypothetical protein